MGEQMKKHLVTELFPAKAMYVIWRQAEKKV